MTKRTLWILLLASFSLVAPFASAQDADATHIGSSLTLSGDWRFQTGDDMSWANTAFDDSGWKLIRGDKSLADYGLRGYRGMLWYRIKIQLAPGHGTIGLRLDPIFTSYEVYSDGVKAAEFGGMPPHGVRYASGSRAVFLPVPADATSTVLAIRVWANTISAVPGMSPNAVMVGSAPAIEREKKIIQAESIYNDLPVIIDNAVALLLGALLLVLFIAQRDHREYLYFGAVMVIGTFATVFTILGNDGVLSAAYQYTISIPLQIFTAVLQIEFLFAFVGVKPNRWVRAFQAVVLLTALVSPFVVFGHAGYSILIGIGTLLTGSLGLLTLVLLAVWFLRGNREAGILLIPLTISNLAGFLGILGQMAYVFHWRKTATSLLPPIQFGPVQVDPSILMDLPYFMTILFIIGRRFVRVSKERERAAAELEAAHGVQTLMIPSQRLDTPGFVVESAYVPAREVGGDFFHIQPLPDGGLLVVIGDVVGKGLQAAMTVSMLVGALRRGRNTYQPLQVLRELNLVLVDQGHAALTTCLCARFTPEHTLIVANAGHPSAYRNTDELPIAGGLPLGVESTTEYVEQSFELNADDKIVFVSDGVIEARNARGELYGFDRFLSALQHSSSPASIARLAQDFGQEDDVTVVAVSPVLIPALT
jgi:Stage II sporulation protein E (SpoIIE)